MPLHDRMPRGLTITIAQPDSANSSDGMRTPIPITPLTYSTTHLPLAMTPDTPAFGMSPFSWGTKVAPEADEGSVEWTEDEDGLLQTYLARPASSAYPPGTLPPPEHLDSLTSEIIRKYGASRSRSASIASSLSAASSAGLELDMDMDSDLVPDSLAPWPSTPSRGTAPSLEVVGWRHDWLATRARLFRIARLESREAVGGHRRDNSESFVPVPQERLTRPKLVVLGHQGISRQQHSMDSVFGDEAPSFNEAIRLSGNLQQRALGSADSVELHATKDLFSPVKIEFGTQVDFAPPTATAAAPSPRKAAPAFPPAKPLPRRSLLQRGRSYTGADLAHMSHSRNTSTSSDISISDDATSPGLPPPALCSALSTDSDAKGRMMRSLSSPTFYRGLPSPVDSLSSQSATSTDVDVDVDPITPLHQVVFPQSVFGMGHRRIGQSPDSTPGSTPAIMLTRTSPTMSDGSGDGAGDAEATPRMGDVGMMGSHVNPSPFDSAPSFAFSNLSLAADEGIDPLCTDLSASSISGSAFAFGSQQQRQVQPSRSLSDLAPVEGRNIHRIPPSISIPANLATHSQRFASALSASAPFPAPAPALVPAAMPSRSTGSGGLSRAALSMTAVSSMPPLPALVYSDDGADIGGLAGHGLGRESKRQRALAPAPAGSSSAGGAGSSASAGAGSGSGSGGSGNGSGNGSGGKSMFRPRLNPGLTVVVPRHVAPALGEGLRSPFEHKTPAQQHGAMSA